MAYKQVLKFINIVSFLENSEFCYKNKKMKYPYF